MRPYPGMPVFGAPYPRPKPDLLGGYELPQPLAGAGLLGPGIGPQPQPPLSGMNGPAPPFKPGPNIEKRADSLAQTGNAAPFSGVTGSDRAMLAGDTMKNGLLPTTGRAAAGSPGSTGVLQGSRPNAGAPAQPPTATDSPTRTAGAWQQVAGWLTGSPQGGMQSRLSMLGSILTNAGAGVLSERGPYRNPLGGGLLGAARGVEQVQAQEQSLRQEADNQELRRAQLEAFRARAAGSRGTAPTVLDPGDRLVSSEGQVIAENPRRSGASGEDPSEPAKIRELRALNIDPQSPEGRRYVLGGDRNEGGGAAEPSFIREMRAANIDPQSPQGRAILLDRFKGGGRTNVTVSPQINLPGPEERQPLTPATTNTVQKDVLGMQDQVSQLRRTLDSFDPNLQRLPERARASFTSLKEYAGFSADPAEKKLVQDVTKQRSQIERYTATIRNNLFGAALTGAERESAGAFLPGADDAPTEVATKLREALEISDLALTRYKIALKRGLDVSTPDALGSVAALTPESVREAAFREGEAIKARGGTEAEAVAEVKRLLGIK